MIYELLSYNRSVPSGLKGYILILTYEASKKTTIQLLLVRYDVYRTTEVHLRVAKVTD